MSDVSLVQMPHEQIFGIEHNNGVCITVMCVSTLVRRVFLDKLSENVLNHFLSQPLYGFTLDFMPAAFFCLLITRHFLVERSFYFFSLLSAFDCK